MKMIKMYTTPFCPFCVRAKHLLKKKGVAFEDVDVSRNRALRQEVAAETGHRTVPMIFVGDEFIGGCNELFALERAGQLDEMLAL
jgi:glutaredoxin 3